MDSIESLGESKAENVKLYTQKSITGATFLGGPLAGGYLIGENFKALNKPEEGRYSLIIGIIVTIALFGVLFLLPDSVIDKLPSQLLPILYTGAVYGIVQWKQGDALEAHEANNNHFFSGWRAAGIALVSLLILFVGIVGYVMLSSNDKAYEQYSLQLDQFSEREAETMLFYDHLDTKTNEELIKELDEIVLPLWNQNIAETQKTSKDLELPEDIANHNKLLIEYSKLRLETFMLLRKSIEEDTDKYSLQIEQLYAQIDEVLSKMN